MGDNKLRTTSKRPRNAHIPGTVSRNNALHTCQAHRSLGNNSEFTRFHGEISGLKCVP